MGVFLSRRRSLAIMQPVVAGLTDDNIEAVAHYFELVQKQPEKE
jgi:cytochrome c553